MKILNTVLDAAGVRSQKQRYIASKLGTDHSLNVLLAYVKTLHGAPPTHDIRYYVSHIRRSLKDHGVDKLASRTPATLQAEWAAKKWDSLSAWLCEEKNTLLEDMSLQGKLVSVEIECLFNNKTDAVKAVQYWKTNNIPVTGKQDGSIRQLKNSQIPIELVFTMPAGDYSILASVCRGLGGNATVNKSCGLHVHFDRRHSNHVDTRLVADKLAGYVPALKKMLPLSRRNNRYCKYAHNHSNRYSFINSKAYYRHGTLEIRGHSGTIDYTKIKNWIEIMQALIRVAEQPIRKYQQVRSINTLLKVLRSVGVGVGLLEYIKERAALFSGDNQHNEEPEYEIAA